MESLAKECKEAKHGCTDCKKRLGEVLVTFLSEPRAKRAELEAHPEHLREILDDGASRARKAARETLGEIKELVGLGKL